ncbi:MAG TPA: hypothetical protein VGK99_07130 [Acidobacteriota bacterium]|jgi:hypothetical protein
MKQKVAAAALLGILTTPFLIGQERNRQSHDRRNSGEIFRFFDHPAFGSNFLFGPRIRAFPILHVPREWLAFSFAEHFVWGNHRPTRESAGDHFLLFRGYPDVYYAGAYGAETTGSSSYASQPFVEEWKGREPIMKGPAPDLTQSTLLAEGMQEEEVVKRLGSPLQRIQLGERQVWKYSGFSLLFESGLLKEIR